MKTRRVTKTSVLADPEGFGRSVGAGGVELGFADGAPLIAVRHDRKVRDEIRVAVIKVDFEGLVNTVRKLGRVAVTSAGKPIFDLVPAGVVPAPRAEAPDEPTATAIHEARKRPEAAADRMLAAAESLAVSCARIADLLSGFVGEPHDGDRVEVAFRAGPADVPFDSFHDGSPADDDPPFSGDTEDAAGAAPDSFADDSGEPDGDFARSGSDEDDPVDGSLDEDGADRDLLGRAFSGRSEHAPDEALPAADDPSPEDDFDGVMNDDAASAAAAQETMAAEFDGIDPALFDVDATDRSDPLPISGGVGAEMDAADDSWDDETPPREEDLVSAFMALTPEQRARIMGRV